MIEIQKYAAIDIGSNAVRLLIANVILESGEEPVFKKNSLIRVPIRLGADVFTEKRISDSNLERMTDTMKAFRLLMKAHGVVDYRACATSAMREADNGKLVVKHIKEKSGVAIQIIDGKEEASIISNTDLELFMDASKTYLYVDVGGGSTEFTIYREGKPVTSKSFQLGTVRILKELVGHIVWDEVEDWIKAETKSYPKVELIGSGGNINKIFKMSGKKPGTPMSYLYMMSFYEYIQSYTYEERISDLGLNNDRADVIVPATRIYLNAMKWSRAKNIHVPKIGLSDGIIKQLFFDKAGQEA